jgi:hypothetical protein
MWATILNLLIGLWLMVSPAFLQMNQQAANNNHIVGPLAITFSVVALWEINRNAVKANVIIGVWLMIALFLLPYNAFPVIFSNVSSGLALVLLSLKKRTAKQNFGGGWRSLFQHNPPHLRAAERELLDRKS